MKQKEKHTKRSKVLFVNSLSKYLGGISLLFCFIILFTQKVYSLEETITVNAIVISTAISPAPPPTPNPIINNGVPLPPSESGTDSAIFRGRAYPGSSILILKNGIVLHEASSYSDGTFEIPVRNIVPGTYTFSLVAKDGKGLKSSPITYTIVITSGAVTEVKGIIIPPTITTDKIQVMSGSDIIFSGKAIPNETILLTLFAKTGITKTIQGNASGTWSYKLTTQGLDAGNYTAKVRTQIGQQYTLYSEPLLFTVGDTNILRKGGTTLINARCDLNNDSRVNLLDFSIMAFWYKRIGFPLKVDLNSDGRINLTDLSILAYCWTG